MVTNGAGYRAPPSLALSSRFSPSIVSCQKPLSGPTVFTIFTVNNETGEEVEVSRSYRDFLWLDNRIKQHAESDMHIYAPFPLSGGNGGKQQSVSSGPSDGFSIDCLVLTRYLTTLCNHWKFGQSESLEKFLTYSDMHNSLDTSSTRRKPGEPIPSAPQPQPTPMYKIPANPLVENEMFKSECDWLTKYEPVLQNCERVVKKKVFTEGDLREIWAGTSIMLQSSPDCTGFNKLLTLFSEAACDLQHSLADSASSNERSLGVGLTLQCLLLNEEKRMLDVWSQKFNHCSVLASAVRKNIGTAREKQLKDDLNRADLALETATHDAEVEVKHFHKQRVQLLSQTVQQYAENQLRIARNLHTCLQRTLDKLKIA